jgi:hypothetical protein
MKSDVCSWVRSSARRAVSALAILAVFGVASPSAFATLTTSYTAQDTGLGAPRSLTTTGSNTFNTLTDSGTVGNFSISITVNSTNSPSSATLSTTEFDLDNKSSGTETIKILVTTTGYTTGVPSGSLVANFATSASSAAFAAADTQTNSSWFDATNAAFGMATPLGSLTGTPILSGTQAGDYAFPNNGTGPNVPVTAGTTPFSLTQELLVTLGANDSVTITINTAARPVPEPSTLGLAGLGALGLIGYGLRRRKARGA